MFTELSIIRFLPDISYDIFLNAIHLHQCAFSLIGFYFYHHYFGTWCYSYWFVIVYVILLKKDPNISNYSLVNCFIFLIYKCFLYLSFFCHLFLFFLFYCLYCIYFFFLFVSFFSLTRLIISLIMLSFILSSFFGLNDILIYCKQKLLLFLKKK